jgi:hypothetical protein
VGLVKVSVLGFETNPETFRQESLEQSRTLAGQSRVAKLKIEPGEQHELKLE